MQIHKHFLEKKMFLKTNVELGRNYPWNKPIKQIEQGIRLYKWKYPPNLHNICKMGKIS